LSSDYRQRNLRDMKLLMLRLSGLDADAENSLRVISFFDELIAQRVPLRVLAAKTAKLAECPVGVFDHSLGVSLRAEPDGRVAAEGSALAEPAQRALSADAGVWLERPGPPFALDDILVERFAIAAALLFGHEHGPVSDAGDDGPVKLALSADASEAQRSRALRAIGFDPGERLCALAVSGPSRRADLLAVLGLARGSARTAVLGSTHAVLTRPPKSDQFGSAPAAVRIGVGPELPGIEAPYSWQQARTARRFTAASEHGPRVVRAEELGALAVIADRIGQDDIAAVPDVAILDHLAAEPGGEDTIAILEALCTYGSVRKAATAVYRHHTTLITRLGCAEERLGFSPTTPAGHLRLELALKLRRLRDNPA
jgi:PucR C-terminal helix-turn-helix domain